MSLLEVIQWLCHGCSCETQLVPSAGISSHCSWSSGGFSVEKRWCGRHFLSWGIHVGAPMVLLMVILGSWQLPWLCSHRVSSWTYPCHPGWVKVIAGTLELQDHCCSLSRGHLAPVTWPHVPSPWPWSCSPTCSAIFGACVVSSGLEGNVVIVAVSSLQGKGRWFPMLVNQAAFSSTEFQQAFLNFFFKTLI